MGSSSLSALLPPLPILLLGYGNVARAFLTLLAARAELLGREAGVRPLIAGVGSRRRGFHIFSEALGPEQFVEQTDLRQLLARGSRVESAEAFIYAGKAMGASLLFELTTLDPQAGQPALEHIRMALQARLHVITANKGPIAFGQDELQKLARQHNVSLYFESTVLDGLPVFNLVDYTLPAVGVQGFRALLNSTSNIVLQGIERGLTLEVALQEAQRLGIAEADPWNDLDGWDAVMKTTILANNLLGGHLLPHMVEREGLRNLRPVAIRTAANSGRPFRLVSQARLHQGTLLAEVRPQQLAPDDILRVGTGTSGVISLETEEMGQLTLVEHDPQVEQTAYGLFSDLVRALREGQQS